jgi:menaquinone-dependent protoporphyrinogen oxidase
MKVLVAYASKYGSTRGIAEFVAKKLCEQGLDAVAREARAVENIEAYDAYVIGSALYMFHWIKEAKQFVSRNRELLGRRPVWLFSSGPVGKEPKDQKGRDLKEVSGPKEIGELWSMIKPRGHAVFFGALIGSRLTGLTGLGYKMATMSKSAREAMPEGDFRDWNEIGAWAVGIAGSLQVAGK